MASSIHLGQLSPREWDKLQALADEYAAECESASPLPMEQFLPRPGEQLRPFVLRELIAIDLDACWRRQDRRRVDHYLPAFPEIVAHAGLLVELLHEELRLRLSHKEQPTRAEYEERHGGLLAELEALLQDRPIRGLDWFVDGTVQTGSEKPADGGTTATFRVDPSRLGVPEVGTQLGDFELLRVLGQGSFGTVFLARQVSLNRQVALKIASDTSTEAQTLASLEHDHIVQVFSETVDGERHLRLLCMQFVAGPTLERVIIELRALPRVEWSGKAILDIVDRLSGHDAPFHPAALRDRELLQRADFVQAVCWFGARLAETLSYAHGQRVLHRDIKPANILLNPYGRPLLADFNVSLRTKQLTPEPGIGGTFAYMAPEHLDACDPHGNTPPEQVGERADIYSLGVTLFELLTGRRPFLGPPSGAAGKRTALASLVQTRLVAVPSASDLCPDIPHVVDGVLRRALAPLPADRYDNAAELARALEGCRELRRIEHDLPQGDRLTRHTVRRPFLALLLIGILPQLAGSAVNIAYNWLEIVSKFETEELKRAFHHVAIGYNLAVYPLCIWLLIRQVLRIAAKWRRLEEGKKVLAADAARSRQRILLWPAWVVGLSALGWLPGGALFPLALHLLAGPISGQVYAHFLISFTLSGLIAMTYSYLGVQFVVLRALYPRFWADPQGASLAIKSELGDRGPRLGLFQMLAGVIPLAGAILMLVLESESLGQLGFRLLAVALIMLGMAGFGLAVAANKYLTRTLEVLLPGQRT
jgi:serine/threonine protein kinase